MRSSKIIAVVLLITFVVSNFLVLNQNLCSPTNMTAKMACCKAKKMMPCDEGKQKIVASCCCQYSKKNGSEIPIARTAANNETSSRQAFKKIFSITQKNQTDISRLACSIFFSNHSPPNFSHAKIYDLVSSYLI